MQKITFLCDTKSKIFLYECVFKYRSSHLFFFILLNKASTAFNAKHTTG